MENPVQPEVMLKALRKTFAALQGMGHEPAVTGALARQAWGSKREAQVIDLLIPSGEAQRESVLGAVRGEGLRQAADTPVLVQNGSVTLRLSYTDSRLGGSVDLNLREAATPFDKQMLGRAQPRVVLQMQLRVATCDDLILSLAGSTAPGDRECVVELLRGNATRIDPAYLKREAEAAGVFDKLKSAWQEARQQV